MLFCVSFACPSFSPSEFNEDKDDDDNDDEDGTIGAFAVDSDASDKKGTFASNELFVF